MLIAANPFLNTSTKILASGMIAIITQEKNIGIGVLTADNTLLSRFVVQNEFRTAADLVDRVTGGAGPGGPAHARAAAGERRARRAEDVDRAEVVVVPGLEARLAARHQESRARAHERRTRLRC